MGGSVLVGLDGTVSSVAAVRWGAEEAAARGLPLHLLHSWASQPRDVPAGQQADTKQQYGAAALGLAETTAQELRPGLEVTTEEVPEHAVEALLDRGRRATLTVLGSRGHGAIAGFLLGSVSLHVLGRAAFPVVTVREEEPAAVGSRPEIVVGVQDTGGCRDPEPDDEAVLDFAFTAADAHDACLRVVRASPDDAAEPPAGERKVLVEALSPWRTRFPAVDVIAEARPGRVVPVLLAACSRAGLLVIGRRLERSPLPLGPVVLAVLHHARCPVAVIPRS
ncbi:universal stress protein [Streptomyces lydicus]|uniref:universal stress protein n=1 Tax=Streptomyces lydicus TaxID=47763 RepID=UPI000523FD33|nr:universal stress protein [Streptomyces lydicus]MDC7340558.1 universal stress protein [Streptomyces lydicus]UEG89751.1 universal stress protein [Streptomyces lydicus]